MDPANNMPICQKNNYILLREVLAKVNVFQVDQIESNEKIQKYCQAIIQDLSKSPIDIVAAFLLLRDMCTYMKSGLEGLGDGEAAIRECFAKVHSALPNIQTGPLGLTHTTVKALVESYSNEDLSEFIELFYTVNQSKVIPSSAFVYLVHFNLLSEPMKRMLYEVLVKSGTQLNEYFILLCTSLGFQSDLGLSNAFLLDTQDEESTDYDSSDESIEFEKVIELDSNDKSELQILELLSKEPDGGYFLLKMALCLGTGNIHSLLGSIKVIKNVQIEDKNQMNSLNSVLLRVKPCDRIEVLKSFVILQRRFSGYLLDRMQKDLLFGVVTVPLEQMGKVLPLLSTFDAFIEFHFILGEGEHYNAFDGVVAAYLLFPYWHLKKQLGPEDWRKILTAVLWEKLSDLSLPPSTLTGLAWYVRSIGLPGHHPLRLLGQIMREAEINEPARSQGIQAKLSEHSRHLSTYRCPLNEVLALHKREIEDPEESDRPNKKLHLG